MSAPYDLQTRKTDTLATTITAGATGLTLTTGSFGTPTYRAIITVDYNVASKAADFECTIAGTSVTNMILLNGPDVSHTSGALIAMNIVDEHYADLRDTSITGWRSFGVTLTYASASTVTASSSVAAYLSVGDKIKFDNSTTKYFYVTGVSGTTITLSAGSDYTVANSAITNAYYSKEASPVGFPQYFTWTPTITCTGSMTISSITNYYSYFTIASRTVTYHLDIIGTTGGTADYGIIHTIPVTTSYTFAGPMSVKDGGAFVPGTCESISTTQAEFRTTTGGNFGLGANRGGSVIIAYRI